MSLTVADLMTPDVVTAREELTFREVAALLRAYAISAVPVVDAGGRVVGVVSEADLLLKAAHEDLAEPRWLEPPPTREARVKAGARVARELMTSPAITAPPSLSVREAARRLQEHKIKRLPVVDVEGRPVGIISRSDIIRVFLRDDAELRRDVVVLFKTLGLDPQAVQVSVADGVVALVGALPRRSDVEVLERLAAEVPGMLAVRSRLRFNADDGHETTRHRLAVLEAG